MGITQEMIDGLNDLKRKQYIDKLEAEKKEYPNIIYEGMGENPVLLIDKHREFYDKLIEEKKRIVTITYGEGRFKMESTIDLLIYYLESQEQYVKGDDEDDIEGRDNFRRGGVEMVTRYHQYVDLPIKLGELPYKYQKYDRDSILRAIRERNRYKEYKVIPAQLKALKTHLKELDEKGKELSKNILENLFD